MAGKKLELGDTGRAVAANVKRLRGARNYTDLSKQLDDLGRDIPPLALRRIEDGTRRVDVDDLTALAVALRVSPTTLLLPYTQNADDPVRVTAWGDDYAFASEVWRWLMVDTSYGWRQFPDLSPESALPAFVYRELMEEKAARMPELRAEFFERRKRRAQQAGGEPPVGPAVPDGDDQ